MDKRMLYSFATTVESGGRAVPASCSTSPAGSSSSSWYIKTCGAMPRGGQRVVGYSGVSVLCVVWRWVCLLN